MKLPLFLQPVDVYERHWVVAKHLRERRVRSVLDVGGEGLLKRFLRGAHCVSVNVDRTGDVQYDGSMLPFGEATFDAVVSLDALEHIPPQSRQHFVAELQRVARTEVALAVPFGSPGHTDIEARALEAYRAAHGRDHVYLREHVECGLPTLDELKTLFVGADAEFAFCGDCRAQAAKFMRRLERTQGEPGRLRAFVADAVAILMDGNYRRVPHLEPSPHEFTNRAYVFARK